MEACTPVKPAANAPDGEDLVHLAEIDDAWRRSLDRMAALACRLLDVPVAQVNVILEDRQRSIASVANHPDYASWNGPRDAPLEAAFCPHVVRTGEPLVIEDSREHPLVKDNPATTEGGIRAYAGVPVKDEDGRVLATLCVVDFRSRSWKPDPEVALSTLAEVLIDDVRGRVRAETDLRGRDSWFRALVERGADLTTVLDENGVVTYASPAYERILDHRTDEVVGQPFLDFVHRDDHERWQEDFFQALADPVSRVSAEWRMWHRDEGFRTVEGTGVNLLHEPAVGGYVLNIMDVSNEKQVELELHQAQKMEAVGRLAGGIAHDFNNLLTAIKGNSAFLLARGDLSPEAEEDVREMVDAVKRASGMTEQLLTFSRDQPLDVRVLDLGQVTDEILPLVKRLLGSRVRLSASTERELPIRADEGQVGQAIMNLAVNARDAMPRGGTLRIDTREVMVNEEQAGSHGDITPGRYAQLVVADEGEGMTREVQERIFDPFFSTKPKGKGTGLGLSITWGVITQLGGHIHVYSEPERGTTFRIYFPWADRAGLPRRSPPGKPARPRSAVRKSTILVIEDQPEVHRIVRKVLEGDGHIVSLAESGEQALEIADGMDDPPDLLLSDVLLPGMTGPEVAWRLVERWPGLKVVFTSGYTRGELVNQELELRDAAFLPKPFGPEELLERVGEAVGEVEVSLP